MFTARITVSLKKGVADPEGGNTKKALELLGFSHVKGVTTSKVFTMELEEDDIDKAKVSAKEMCERLLANPVIQNYDIEIF
ncbi:MAG TPA: phosphoribosylformylglycinamidine synthase, purS protein [Euryarchaeota archaeon]|nr:phosphoribosylformylglycinamidine synthase, purS protein [Euryarchaeota archaeon]